MWLYRARAAGAGAAGGDGRAGPGSRVASPRQPVGAGTGLREGRKSDFQAVLRTCMEKLYRE